MCNSVTHRMFLHSHALLLFHACEQYHPLPHIEWMLSSEARSTWISSDVLGLYPPFLPSSHHAPVLTVPLSPSLPLFHPPSTSSLSIYSLSPPSLPPSLLFSLLFLPPLPHSLPTLPSSFLSLHFFFRKKRYERGASSWSVNAKCGPFFPEYMGIFLYGVCVCVCVCVCCVCVCACACACVCVRECVHLCLCGECVCMRSCVCVWSCWAVTSMFLLLRPVIPSPSLPRSFPLPPSIPPPPERQIQACT